ncbi:MAG: ABC transporter permease [Rhodospirillales bacterium]|nr:ABC transporter permease [Rhodospirillales bacterium]
MMRVLRPLLVLAGVCAAWELVVRATGVPHYILPGPVRVANALAAQHAFILENAATTLLEMLLGMLLGVACGSVSALLLAQSRAVRRWFLPLVLASQAIPVFAIAPLLVLWLGFGIASKVAAAALIIFFPVTSAFYDGLVRTERGWLDLAHVMGARPAAILLRLRVPAALPALASGIRVAAAVAPIGAVIGEWVGASAGLGFLMLQANAQMQVDLLFAALSVLALFAIAFYAAIDRLLRLLVPWQPVTSDSD